MTFSQWINTSEPLTDIDKFINDIDTKIASIRSILSSDVSNISHKEMVIEQYKTCVWFLSDFFSFTRNHYWEEDGIWSCGISEYHSESEIDGPFMGEILKLRAQKRPKRWNTHPACSFHREKVWCILWWLKSPLCVTHVDSDVPDTYDENKFREFLYTIQLAWWTPKNWYKDTNPQKNWLLVIEFLEEVKKNTLALKSL